MFVIFVLMLVSSTSFARSKFCGVHEWDYKTCKKGDIIYVRSEDVGKWCDFNKAIVYVWSVSVENNSSHKTDRMFNCVYLGYKRKNR
jgi:hypothetical protein